MTVKMLLQSLFLAVIILSYGTQARSAEPAVEPLSGNTTTIAKILALTTNARSGELTYFGQAPVEFLVSRKDQCLIGMNVRVPVAQNWDGSAKTGQKIAFQIAVSFRDVQERYTQSSEYQDADGESYFVVRFYDAPIMENNYGKKYYFEFYDDGRYVDLSNTHFEDFGGNLSGTPLGSFAAGDTFSLTFQSADRQEAISLLKSAFADCK